MSALDGLVVIDATWGLPGAIGTSMLADYGARVVKIERPTGDDLTPPQHRAVFDRNKWSVALDPGTDGDLAQLRDLVVRADVFIESYGPGCAERFGLTRGQLAGDAPGLVVCSLTGYGQDGPWRDRPGYDALVAARLGLMHDVNGIRPGPTFIGNAALAYGTGFLLAIDVLAALAARHTTGRGQSIDVSLLDGALAQTPMMWWWSERGLSFIDRSEGAGTGFGRSRIITDIFECGDGEHVMVHSGGEGGFKRAMDILGFGDEVATITDRPEMSVPLDDRELHIARVLAPEVFKTSGRDEWVRRFSEADLAVKPVLRPGEILLDEQVEHAGMTSPVEDPVLGPLIETSPVIVFRRTPARPPAPAPRPDEHRHRIDEVASGFSPPRRVAATPTAPLAGVRVLDFSSFFATAYGAKLLGDLGADVIKIEPPAGDQLRPFPDPFEACNRGKRSLSIDLRHPDGMQAILDLVATSDVVMHNLRPGKAERAGVGYEQVAPLNPTLIYAYLPGFGSSGPRQDEKSFEPLLSGFTGLNHEASGAGNPPTTKPFGNADYYNGLLGCVAVLMALDHRNRTGEGQYLESPHLHSSLFAVSHNVLHPDGTPIIPDVQLDADQLGWGPTYRLFETRDGWVCVTAVGDAMVRRLLNAVGGAALAGDRRFSTETARRTHREELGDQLAARFSAMTTIDACALLDSERVPCERLPETCGIPGLLWEPWALGRRRVAEHEHPAHGRIREIGLVTHLADTPAVDPRPNALLGRHSREVLTELGRADAEIDRLVADGVVVESEHR